MTTEGTELDRKSLQLLTKANPDWDSLALDCVAFANARGGRILIGIEDDDEDPPLNQKVPDDLVEQINKRIPQLTVQVGVTARKQFASNGGEYIELQVLPSAHSIASTSNGRYYIRVADAPKPVLPDELGRLFNDKNAFVWEAHVVKRVPRNRIDGDKLDSFMEAIQKSDRVSNFVREKTRDELLDYYLFAKGSYLTNLGILWIGRREDRATLAYAPAIQFTKYDERESKVSKRVWDDYSLNPLELIEAVWREVPDWQESVELPDGLFRKTVPHYDELVVRELLAKALVHRPYTQRGDIFVGLFPDRLEVHNPGLLPLGVTPANILHTTVKRNDHLARVFYDLRLMEREGSGFDRMYEVLLSAGKPVPEVREGGDRVTVIVRKQIMNPRIVDFMVKADQSFELKPKERIALGVVVQQESLTAIDLCKALGLKSAADLKPWLSRLLKWGIVKTKGRTKATEYYVDPELLRKLDFRGRTSLRGIEKHRLQELIVRDLQIYREAGIREIQARIGPEIPVSRVRRELFSLMKNGLVKAKGRKRWTTYSLLNRTA